MKWKLPPKISGVSENKPKPGQPNCNWAAKKDSQQGTCLSSNGGKTLKNHHLVCYALFIRDLQYISLTQTKVESFEVKRQECYWRAIFSSRPPDGKNVCKNFFPSKIRIVCFHMPCFRPDGFYLDFCARYSIDRFQRICLTCVKDREKKCSQLLSHEGEFGFASFHSAKRQV